MFWAHISPVFLGISFILFVLPFYARRWKTLAVYALWIIALGCFMVLGAKVPLPRLFAATAMAGVGLRIITLILRKATRARLATKGLHENARVAGRKLVLIGVFLGFPVWMQLALPLTS